MALHSLGPAQPSELSIDPTDGYSVLHGAGILEHHGEWDEALHMYTLAAELLRSRQNGVYAENCVKEVRVKLNGVSTASAVSLLNRRTILLDEPVCEAAAQWVIAKMLFLQDQDAAMPIYLWVDSDGGSVIAGLAIIETIRKLKLPVYTLCRGRAHGRAHGMAAVILASGQKGQRRAYQDARLSVMPLQWHDQQTEDETAKDRLLQDLIALVCERSWQPREAVQRDFERGRYFDAQGAHEYGLIDMVMD